MKIKEGFIVRSVAGSNIVVPVGEQTVNFNGIITLNETGMYLWDYLVKGADKAELLEALLKEYDAPADIASKDIDTFIEKLEGAGLVE